MDPRDGGQPPKKLRRVARALYEGDASTEAADSLAAFGLKLEGADKDDVECWPDNWQALQVFDAMSTQWNVGAESVVIGLRYEALPFVMQALGVKAKNRKELLAELRVMEKEALEMFNQRS